MEIMLDTCKDWCKMVVVFFMAVPVFLAQMISLILDPEKKHERNNMVERYWPYAIGFLTAIITIIVIAKIMFKDDERWNLLLISNITKDLLKKIKLFFVKKPLCVVFSL